MNPANERIIRFGIIGTGRIAGDFADDLKLAKNVRLQAVLSRSVAGAGDFQRKHAAAKAYHSLDEFLKDPEIDAVYVATPNSSHAGFALAAIRAGKPVLIEKPIATCHKDAVTIGSEAAEHGVLAMEAMWIRYLPGILHAKAIIDQGALGKIRQVRGELSYAHQYDPKSRMFDKALGGGVSLDLGVYLLSLTTLLFGPPESVSGSWKAAPSRVDSQAAYTLAYPSFDAALITSFERNGANVFEIEGENAVLRIEDPFIRGRTVRLLRGAAMRSRLMRPDFGTPANTLQKLAARLPLPGQRTARFNYPGHGLHFEAEAFANAILSGQHASGAIADSAQVLAMIEAVLATEPLGA